MAQAFLETDFLLPRPIPARAPVPAASRPVFAIRDPETGRTQARPQDARVQTARTRDIVKQGAAAQDARTQDARTEVARSNRGGPAVSHRSERPSVPADASRGGAASPARKTADPSGKASSGNGGTEGGGSTRDRIAATPAGATGAPDAVVAIAGAEATAEAGSAEETVTEGTKDDSEAAEASVEEADPSLLALGFLPPPPPPKSPVLHGAQGSKAEGDASAGQVSSSSGPAHPSDGALEASPGALTAVAGRDARPQASMTGKVDPAVAVHDTKAAPMEVALPNGFSQVRESFESMLPGAALAPAAAPVQTSSASVTQSLPPAAAPVPLGAVPMTIGLRSLQGSNHFEIRLDPGDLGRIDVSLDIDKERGTVMAHLVVDRVETLALLQRDAGSLQQALAQAGLDASEASINVSLRSDTQSGGRGAEGQGSDGRRPEGRPGGPGLPGQPEGRAALQAVPLRTLRGLTGLDIRI